MQRDHASRLGDSDFTVHRAAAEDVPQIVALLRNDRLGQTREVEDLAAYERAFRMIDSDPQHFLAVVRDEAATTVGTMQLTLLPGLSRGGTTRLQIEGVRVADGARGRGVGSLMLEWAEQYGLDHGASLVQLTTDKSRGDAHRFYDRSGYTASHEGYKKQLGRP